MLKNLDITTVNAPGAQFEQEADSVAKMVATGASVPPAQRQELPEEEVQTQRFQRQALPEDEVQTMRLQRQEVEEDEAVQMQELAEEEEDIAQMQEMPEEDELAKDS